MAYVPNSGSVAAWIQSDSASVITVNQSSVAVAIVSGSITASFTPPANQSVSGTVGASIVGNVPVVVQSSVATVIIGGSIAASFTPPANQSVSGAVSVSNFPANQSVSGSVGITGTPAVSVQGTVFVSGSVVTVGGSGPANQSVSGTVNVGNLPANTSVSGAVSISNLPANQSISGTIGSSIIGTVPVTGFPTNPSISGTVLVNNGSVVAFQGTSPWIETFSNSSIIAIASGSVVSVPQGSVISVIQNSSIIAVPTGNQSISGSIGIVGTPSISGSVNISGSIAGTYAEPAVVTSITGIAIVFKGDNSASTMSAVGVSHPLPVSVQGTISVGNTVTINPPSIYGNISGSVVAFQGAGWSGSVAAVVTGIPSVAVNVQSSVAVAIISGSIAASFTPPANQSVSGTVAVNLNSSNASVITVSQSSIAVAIVSGSIAASFTPPANQSISGVVMAQGLNAPSASVTGNPVMIGGIDGNGSVQAAKVVTVVSVAGGLAWLGIASVSGIAGASIIGLPNFNISDGTNTANVLSSVGGSNSSVMQGALLTAGGYLEVPFNASVNGSIVSTDVSNYRWVSYQIKTNGTAATTTFQTSNDGVNWVSTALLSSAAVGLTIPAVSAAAAGVFYGPLTGRYFRGSITGMTAASTVGVVEFFTVPGAMIGTPNGEIFLADNVDGVSSVVAATTPKVLNRNTVWDGASGTWNRMPGSTAGVYNVIRDAAGNARGTNVNASNQLSVSMDGFTTSIAGAVQVSGSVFSLQQGGYTNSIIGGASVFQFGTWKTSIASNYAVGAASVVSAIGNLELGVRNDTLSSIFAADGQYTPFTVGPVGEVITQNSPITAWTSGVASVFTGTPQPVITSVAANYIYVTGVQIANASANNVYLSFSGAGLGSVVGSTIGYTVAPANGGSNIFFPNPLKTQIGRPFQASISGVASIFISAQGFLGKV